MHKVWALVRSNWLSASSYKLGFVFSFGSLVLSVVPMFFVAGALQNTMAGEIQGQGDQYFAFLVVGLIALNLVSSTIYALPGGLQTATSTGTLEALLATPTSVSALLVGLSGYEVLLALLRGLVMLIAAGIFGAHVAWLQLGASMPIVALVVLAHFPIAIIRPQWCSRSVRAGRCRSSCCMASTFLGGVYYPRRSRDPGLDQGRFRRSPADVRAHGATRGAVGRGLDRDRVARVSILGAFTASRSSPALSPSGPRPVRAPVGNLAQY